MSVMSEDSLQRVEEKLREIMAGVVDGAEIGLHSRLVEDLKLGSLRTVELVIQLEDDFDISISDDELTSLVTMGDLVDLIDAKTAAI